jgi:protein SCO1/2
MLLPKRFIYPFIFAFVFIVGLLMIGLLLFPKGPALKGNLVQPPKILQDFKLPDANGGTVHLADFRGKLTLFFFGYTHCPDMSPSILSEVSEAFYLLGDQAGQVRMVMVSVDPERDTPQEIASYAAFYHPDFTGLTGSPEEVSAVAQQFNVIYYKHEGSEATGYLINHTATLTLVDAAGQIREVFEFGTSAADIAADISYWLDQAP